ncbi:MAG: hypothetical protein GQ569_12725, partial [Methylococcaceae bacterium]|nr:hypothetical protein [Methylococcaceae bacterium]
YSNSKFKHLLLPTWISAYRFQDKTYQFVVNARTGQVQGGRPYSVVKIVFAVLVAIIVSITVIGVDWQGINDALEEAVR